MSDFTINYRGLAHAKEIPTQNDVTLTVRNEVHWEPATDERKPRNFLAVRGAGTRDGAAIAVDWAFPATEQLPGLIDAFVNHVDATLQSRRLLQEYQELQISCEPVAWLVLGWTFSPSDSHGYATFRKDGASITATFAHYDAVALIRNALR
jgi:hypothetical protein